MAQPTLQRPREPVVAARRSPDGRLPIPWTPGCRPGCRRTSRAPPGKDRES